MSEAVAGPGAPLLSAHGLGRRFRRVRALEGVDVDLAPGESLALLGPNGAGKTTLLGMLAGVVRPDEGTISWTQSRPAIGWVPQRPAVYARLSTRENLVLFAGLEGRADPQARALELLSEADLARFADRRAEDLSTGTLQRLNLAVALTGDPSVLLLDEPTATVSPDQRRRLWAWLERLRSERDLAVIFSTQSVSEAARHADRMLVLVDGRPAFSGSVDRMIDAYGAASDPHDDRAGAAFVRLVEGRVGEAG